MNLPSLPWSVNIEEALTEDSETGLSGFYQDGQCKMHDASRSVPSAPFHDHTILVSAAATQTPQYLSVAGDNTLDALHYR